MQIKTIVIVDDFKSTLEIIRKAIERKGYKTLLASNGQDALEYFDGRKIDLLITDFEMPGMNGAELIRLVRERTNYEFLPTLILSSSPESSKKNLLSDINVGGWIQKPFDIHKFYEIIDKYLHRN